jgi:hypothetical protein
MKAMGLRPGINWLAWFVSTFLVMLVVAFVVSFILKYGGIFPETNQLLIFIALVAFAFSAIMLRFVYSLETKIYLDFVNFLTYCQRSYKILKKKAISYLTYFSIEQPGSFLFVLFDLFLQ